MRAPPRNGPHVAMRAPGRASRRRWAFGDNINDIPMLQAAGHGMAMINAEPEDRDAADAITEFDNDHDGVARTIMAALAVAAATRQQLIWDGASLAAAWCGVAKIARPKLAAPVTVVVGDTLREKAARTVPSCRQKRNVPNCRIRRGSPERGGAPAGRRGRGYNPPRDRPPP